MSHKHADILIIGGGVHGAGLAFHLARAKLGHVVLLEKHGIATGPTAKSGAMIRPIFTERAYIELVNESIKMFEQWDDRVGGTAGFVQRGFLRMTQTLDGDRMGGDLNLMKELGVQYEILSGDRLAELAPMGEFRSDEQGLWLPDSGYADPVLTAVTLARAAERHGAGILEGVQVLSIEVRSGRIESVETTDGPIRTRTVVNCAGPWATRIAAMVGVELPIETHRTPTCLFQRPPSKWQDGPILSDGVNLVYLRDQGDGLLRGAHFGWAPDPDDPDDYDETVSVEQIRVLRDALRRRYQAMRHNVFFGGFSAVYDMTPDAHPIVGPIAQVPGFWCNCGWSGNGFASGPSIGRSVAAMLAGADGAVDLSLFAWPRPEGTTMRPDMKLSTPSP